MDTRYKRVMLKVSGEALAEKGKAGISPEMLARVAEQVKALRAMGIEVAMVVGGGNFWRGRSSGEMDRATADHMGMLATCMNGLALQDALRQAGIPAYALTAISMPQVAEPFTIRGAREHLEQGHVVICAGGIAEPFFTTDTTAALRAAEVQADVILLAKNIDAVYTADPNVDPTAKKLSRISHTEVLEKDLKVMDSTAASICRDNGITIHVFGLADPENILRAVRGEEIGTVIE